MSHVSTGSSTVSAFALQHFSPAEAWGQEKCAEPPIVVDLNLKRAANWHRVRENGSRVSGLREWNKC
jgi:hypothetical protein